jgi:tripeptide aminopeptidase
MDDVTSFVKINADLVQNLFEAIDARRDVLTARVREIAEMPSPTHDEAKRSEHLAGLFPHLGLRDVTRLAKGSIMGFTGSVNDTDTLLLAAHIDNVFPIDTDLRTSISGSILYGPGTGDNAANVAAIVTLAEIVKDLQIDLRRNIGFCGTVCEEGAGNLAGIREVLDYLGEKVATVIAVDGRMPSLMHRSQAARRYHLETTGPGGHSWDGFGTHSAIHEMAKIVTALSEVEVPVEPRTTFNVGTILGGKSVNAIAQSCAADIDLRSLETSRLAELERDLLEIVARVPAEGIHVEARITGERPAAEEPLDSKPIKTAIGAARHLGFEAELTASSTDAALSLSRGISSISMGTYRGKGVHTLEEQVELTSLTTGLKWLALTVLVLAG